MKECQECREAKKENEFYITSHTSHKKYYDSVCKKCRNKQRYRIKFTKEEKIKKWNEEIKKVWGMGKWLKKKK